MALRFLDVIKPTSPDELTPIQQHQLREAGLRHDDSDLPISERFKNADEDAVLQFLEIWQVVDDDGTHLYDAYIHSTDSGTVFLKDTTTVVAERFQFDFDRGDETLCADLHAGYARTRNAKTPGP